MIRSSMVLSFSVLVVRNFESRPSNLLLVKLLLWTSKFYQELRLSRCLQYSPMRSALRLLFRESAVESR